MIDPHKPVRWSECLPNQLQARMKACPIVYLPLGLCEPHGQIAAYGLDLIKAEYLCEGAARAYGGSVAPSMGYHMHETGFHARWLEEEVGEENPRMTSLPPHVMLYVFLYQLRNFANAGFTTAIVVSGHGGGNEEDLRLAAARFEERFGFSVYVYTDVELVKDQFNGDHAGQYEISQLMYVRPDLVDLSAATLAEQMGTGGTLAVGHNAGRATPELGERICQAALHQLGLIIDSCMRANANPRTELKRITIQETEAVWQSVLDSRHTWVTASPRIGQTSVSARSQWKSSEHPYGEEGF